MDGPGLGRLFTGCHSSLQRRDKHHCNLFYRTFCFPSQKNPPSMEKHLVFSAFLVRWREARDSRSLLLANFGSHLNPLIGRFLEPSLLVNINYLPRVILDAVSFVASSQSWPRKQYTSSAVNIFKIKTWRKKRNNNKFYFRNIIKEAARGMPASN